MKAAVLVSLLLASALGGCMAGPAEAPAGPGQSGAPGPAGPTGGPTSGAPGTPPQTNPPDEPAKPTNRTWPEPSAASIRPGVEMVADGQQCTSNFVFTSRLNDTVYLGFAAHCVAEGDQMDTNGCQGPVPFALGTKVDVEGASMPASLVYSSWTTMQAGRESDANACADNDFAFVALDESDRNKVSPAMRVFGGPTGIAPAGSGGIGSKVLTYGNTGLRFGIEPTNPREGVVFGHGADDWTTIVYTATPGLPGDSGSGVLHGDGQAMGILVTVGLAPYTASNGVTSLEKALAYANANGWDLELATWEQLSDGNLP